MALAAQAFSYVWPNTGRLRVRVAFCFLLVAIERCVNIAVPIVYKYMVEQLGGFTQPGPDANSTVAPAARALLARCAAVVNGTDGLLSAAAAAALLRDTVSAFWAAFYPWTLLYLIMFWLRGGSGAEGLLANVRDLLWIPITQVMPTLCHNNHCACHNHQGVSIDEHCCSCAETSVTTLVLHLLPLTRATFFLEHGRMHILCIVHRLPSAGWPQMCLATCWPWTSTSMCTGRLDKSCAFWTEGPAASRCAHTLLSLHIRTVQLHS